MKIPCCEKASCLVILDPSRQPTNQLVPLFPSKFDFGWCTICNLSHWYYRQKWSHLLLVHEMTSHTVIIIIVLQFAVLQCSSALSQMYSHSPEILQILTTEHQCAWESQRVTRAWRLTMILATGLKCNCRRRERITDNLTVYTPKQARVVTMVTDKFLRWWLWEVCKTT